MNKVKNYIKFLACLVLFLGVLLGSVLTPVNASANTVDSQYDEEIVINIENDNARGLTTSIRLSLDGEDGRMTAKAYNVFTLGWSTIPTYIELYRSIRYTEYVGDMVLVAQAHTDDLNIYESITASFSTAYESAYWVARMRYKMDSNDWVAINTNLCYYDADANLIQKYEIDNYQ